MCETKGKEREEEMKVGREEKAQFWDECIFFLFIHLYSS